MSTPRLQSLKVVNHHVLPDHTIDLQGHDHLIITGPNGAGKTTLMRALYSALTRGLAWEANVERERQAQQLAEHQAVLAGAAISDLPYYESFQAKIRALRVEVTFGNESRPSLLTFLTHDRRGTFATPSGPARLAIDPKQKGFLTSEFLQLLVNLHTTALLEKTRTPARAAELDAQLAQLQAGLALLLQEPDLRFDYDSDAFEVRILLGGGRAVLWDALAAGHRSILEIVADIYARLHAGGLPLNAGGIVLIDEPELHLHPELQERILPGLIMLFPTIQFVVATHAAPVICSIPNAWVHDLRKQEGQSSSNLVGRPYGSVMVAHFRVPTDYDAATTAEVEEWVRNADAATTREAKEAALQALGGLLSTNDGRVLDRWTRLSLELES